MPKELEILATAYQTFIGRTHIFDVLSEKKWSATGIENWVQTEIIVALIDRGYDVTTRGKIKRDCDVIITDNSGFDVGLELRAGTAGDYKWLLQGIVSHQNADLYLFISRVDSNTISGLGNYFRQYNFIEDHRMLNDDWMIMLVKSKFRGRVRRATVRAHASAINYWLTPVRGTNAEEVVKTLVSEEGIWAYGDRTPGRNELKPGDWLCFYATGKGAIGHAKVMSIPEKKPHLKVLYSEKYPWTFKVDEAKLYLDNPKIIDAEMRKKLSAFKDKPLQQNWGWFLYSARKISEEDFKILTRE